MLKKKFDELSGDRAGTGWGGEGGLAGVRVWWPLPHCDPVNRMWRLGCRPAEGGVSSQRALPTNPTVFLETKGWNWLQKTKQSLVLCHFKGRGGQSYCGLLATSWRMRTRAEASYLQPVDRSEFWIRWRAEQKGVTGGDAQERDHLLFLHFFSHHVAPMLLECFEVSGVAAGRPMRRSGRNGRRRRKPAGHNL